MQREQVMLPLKVLSPEMPALVSWPMVSPDQQATVFARIGKREEPPRDRRPRRALQRECVVTKEIRSSALAVRRTF